MMPAMSDPYAPQKHDPRVVLLKATLLVVWAAVSFGVCFFARDLQFLVGQWPFGYWMAAQGGVIAFILIVAGYSWAMKRLSPEDSEIPPEVGGV